MCGFDSSADTTLLLAHSRGATLHMDIFRMSSSVSEPATPPSDHEGSHKDARGLQKSSNSLGRETPPPQIEYAGYLEPRRAPHGLDSETAATLMTLSAAITAKNAPSSSPRVRKSKNSRKRKSSDASAAPAEQVKRCTMGPADRQTGYLPSAGQFNPMIGPGVMPHFPVFTHDPSHSAAFAQQQSAPVWRPEPQVHAQQTMVSRAARSPQPASMHPR